MNGQVDTSRPFAGVHGANLDIVVVLSGTGSTRDDGTNGGPLVLDDPQLQFGINEFFAGFTLPINSSTLTAGTQIH